MSQPMPSPKRIGSCAYCGREAPITKDHIPPQNLFPDPKPSNLITVPCCEECRSGWSDDDEYFRLAVVSASNQYDGSHAEKVNETVLRSLRKPNKGGFARLVRESLMEIDVRTEAGIYLGTAGGLAINKKRFDQVAERIIRGLFWHEKRYPVPTGYEVTNRFSQFGLGPVLDALGNVRFASWRNIGNGVFLYTFAPTDEDPDSMVWLSVFYQRLPFAGFTVKPKHLR